MVVVDFNLTTAQETVDLIQKQHGQALAVQCDVSKFDQVKAAVATALQTYGQIDILAAVAGIGDRKPAEDMTMDQWDRVIDYSKLTIRELPEICRTCCAQRLSQINHVADSLEAAPALSFF